MRKRESRYFPPPTIEHDNPEWSHHERATLLDWYAQTHGPGDGRLAPFAPFLIDNCPAAFKRFRQHSVTIQKVGGTSYAYAPAWIYTYAAIGFGEGCLYEIIATRGRGLTKNQIQEILAYAYLSSGPYGMNEVAKVCGPYMAAWEDDGRASTHEWPEGWAIEPAIFKSGIDYAKTGFDEDDVSALEAWYERMGGGIPKHVRLWAEMNPLNLKTQRMRFETGIGETLPAQVFPLCQLHLATYRIQPQSVCRSLLQAKNLGVRRGDAVQVMEAGFFYGGEWQMEIVLTDEVAAILRAWTD